MEPARNDTIQRVSVVDNVTVLLRRALLAGEIKPGERIKVAELEKSFGVSHIPIREAVRRLETEGLIVALPQRAAVAAGVDLDDLGGLYDLRRIVECEVIRRSVDAMTRRAGRERCARRSRRSRPSRRTTTRPSSGSSTASSTGRCSSRARPRGSGACSTRSGSPRSGTCGCSSPRPSTTRWPTTASCSRAASRATRRAAEKSSAGTSTAPSSRCAQASSPPVDDRPASPSCAPPSSPSTRRRPRRASAPEPQAADGKAVVELLAAALNPADLAIASGSFPAGSPPLPYVPGIEGVGRVVQSARFAPGTRVWASGRGLGVAADGPFAERFAAAEEALVEVPEGADDLVAAALGEVGLAAWMPLSWLAPVRPGESVLVLGATGSVGSVAVQAAKLLGAGRVVAVGRDAARLEAAASSAPTPPSRSTARLRERLAAASTARRRRSSSTRSGGRRSRRRAPSPAPGARIVHVGQSAAPTARSPSGLVRGKQLQILGYSNFAVPLDALAQGYADGGRRTRRAAGSGSTPRRCRSSGSARRGRGRRRAATRSSSSFRERTRARSL